MTDIVPDLQDSLTQDETPHWWPFSREVKRWSSSLGMVLLAYTAPLTWWLWLDDAPGANLPPPAAMVVELALAPVAPPTVAELPTGPEQAAATPPPAPEPESQPEPELPPAPIAPEPEVAIDPTPEPPPEEQPPVEKSPPQEPEEESALQEEPAATASAPPDAPQNDDVEAAAPNQGMSTPVIDQSRLMDWQSNLMLRLNDAKRYPADARRLRQEGIAYLRFTMDRKGVVLAASVERSSGRPLLDEETLALIERAQPLPQPPEDMLGETLEFVVPVEFFLNR